MILLAAVLLISQFQSQITPVDWVVIAICFCILLSVAWWVVRRGKDSAADYCLAGRNLGWGTIWASVFASNIGSEHVVRPGGRRCDEWKQALLRRKWIN